VELSRNPAPAPDQADQLLQLLDACHRILPTLDESDSLAGLLRDACQAAETRLQELNGQPPDVAETESRG